MIRTGYSFKTAWGHLRDVASRLDEIGWTSQPIADRNSTYAFARWTKIVQRPIYGVELAVVPSLGEKKPTPDFWSFYAKDDLLPLNRLIGLATSNPGREPSLTYQQALGCEGLIKITGERVQLEHIQPQANLFIGLSPSIPRGLYKSAVERGLPFLATSCNYYPRATDKEIYRIALGFRSNTQTYPMHILSDDEWRMACSRFASHHISAIANRNLVLDSCRAEMKKAVLFEPVKEKTLRQMCEEGALRLGVNLQDQVYATRLERELKMIAEKKFEDYFYIIADMMNWAKQNMICGPARGSSCGSLVCYLLNITAIDPIPYGLLFERFIDTTRADLPDIDLDFSDERRQMVFDYMEQKYGRDHVARLGTVSLFKPKSAMHQTGKSLKVPNWQIEKVLDGVIKRSLGDSRAWQTLEDTFTGTDAGRKIINDYPEVAIAATMEGHPNNASQHAAGLLLTQGVIQQYVAVDSRTKSAMCDKYDAEGLNLLKIDALGLTQLSIFERVLELIGQESKNGFLEKLPLDDTAAFEVLNKGHFAGVFQFNGTALQSLAKQFKITCLQDIIDITALARPGPMATGGANLWAKRKTGRAPIEYPHPVMKQYLEKSLGIVIYQEDVLKIGREVGDLSWGDVTQLRKAMSRSLGKEYFDQWGDKWKIGAMKRGIDKDTADEIWTSLCSMGSWAFNLAHAVAYGLVSYYCCWLKAHHTLEFAAATLDAEPDPARQIMLLRELKSEGVDYVPIDLEHSTERWSIKDLGNSKILVGPLTAIKGIGPAAVREILTTRQNGETLRPSIAKKLLNGGTSLATLYPVADAIKKLQPDLMNKIETQILSIKDIQCGVNGNVVALACVTKIAPKDENEAVNIMKRGGRRLNGPTQSLNMFIRDDTDEVFCKINRFLYEKIGRQIAEKGRAGKSLYAFKGPVPKTFRMIEVRDIMYLGEMDGLTFINKEAGGKSDDFVDP